LKSVAQMSLGELAAYVCSHLKEQQIDVVLSGGGCVALYSGEQYVSYDLDFIENVAVGGRKLKQALEMIGFLPDDRYYKHPQTEFILEFPTGPLAVGAEAPGEIVGVPFATGVLRTLSPTDCVKDRLAAFFHWHDLECLDQALLVGRGNRVDLQELERWSAQEGFPDLFQQFKKSLQTR